MSDACFEMVLNGLSLQSGQLMEIEHVGASFLSTNTRS
jgi:hypothetical protein